MRFTMSLTLASCFVFHAQLVRSETDQPKPLAERDFSKTVVIERPVEAVLTNAIPGASRSANAPVHQAGAAPANPSAPENPRVPTNQRVPTIPSAAVEDNPAVQPGIVRWHPNLQLASNKSAQAGKPVLLFHLLGNLDQRFT